MNRFASWMTAGVFILGASSAARADNLPRPSRDDLRALQQQMGNLFDHVNQMLGLTGGGNSENDAKARVLILEFSKNLEKLQDALDRADANWDDNNNYGRAIKDSCLATRKLFLSNSRARGAAGEHSVGQLRPDNHLFDDNKSDVKDIRKTVYCGQIEKTVDAQTPGPLQNSNWQTGYWVNGKKIDATVQLQNTNGNYQATGLQGQFFDIVYFPGHVSGRWQANGTKGWFEFPLGSDQNSFSGYWGNDDIGSPIGGEWSGHKK